MDDFRVGPVPTPSDPYRQPSRSISRKQEKEHGEEGSPEPEEEASDSFQTHEEPPADEPVADYYVPSDPTDAE
jgi:hypothetical protein